MTLEFIFGLWDFWMDIEDYRKHEEMAKNYVNKEFSSFIDGFLGPGSCPYFFKMQRSSVSEEDYKNFVKIYQSFNDYYDALRTRFGSELRTGTFASKYTTEKYMLMMMPYFIQKHGGSIKDFSNLSDLFNEKIEFEDILELLYRRGSDNAAKVIVDLSGKKEKIKELKNQARSIGLDLRKPPFIMNYFHEELGRFDGNLQDGIELIEKTYGPFILEPLKKYSPHDAISLINFLKNPSIDTNNQYRNFILSINEDVRPPVEFLSLAGRSRFTLYEPLGKNLSRFGGHYVIDDANSIKILKELEKRGWGVQEQINEPKIGGFMMTRSVLLKKDQANRLVFGRIHFEKTIDKEANELIDNLQVQNKTARYSIKSNRLDRLPPIHAVVLPLHEENRFGNFSFLDNLPSSIEIYGKIYPLYITEYYADICRDITQKSLSLRTFDIRANAIASKSPNLKSVGESYRFYRLKLNERENLIIKAERILWENSKIKEKEDLDELGLMFANNKMKRGLITSVAERIIENG